MQHFVLYVVFSILFFYIPTLSAAQINKTYHNKRFGYSITYPSNLLYPQGESDNGDGQKFLTKEGDTLLLVYGTHNIDNQTIEERYHFDSRGNTKDNPKKVVTYRILKANWFVVSGYLSGKIFYQKTILSNEHFKTFYFEYPEAKKQTYDPLIKQLVSSFR